MTTDEQKAVPEWLRERALEWLSGYLDVDYSSKSAAIDAEDYTDFTLSILRELREKGLLRHKRWAGCGDECTCGLDELVPPDKRETL